MKAAGDERENATAPVTAVDVAGGSGGDAELLSLLHRAGTGVAFLNAEGRVAHANHVFAHMVGVGDAALRSLTIERLVAPHDRAEADKDGSQRLVAAHSARLAAIAPRRRLHVSRR